MTPIRPSHVVRSRRKGARLKIVSNHEVEHVTFFLPGRKGHDRRIERQLAGGQCTPATSDIERERFGHVSERAARQRYDHRLLAGIPSRDRDGEKAVVQRTTWQLRIYQNFNF